MKTENKKLLNVLLNLYDRTLNATAHHLYDLSMGKDEKALRAFNTMEHGAEKPHSKILSRWFFLWVRKWVELFESIVSILTFTAYSPMWSFFFVAWRSKASLKDKIKQKKGKNEN